MWCERVEGLGIFPLDGQMRRMLVREIQRDRDIVELQKCPAFIDIADFDIEIGAIPIQGLPDIGYGNRNLMKSFHEVNLQTKGRHIVYVPPASLDLKKFFGLSIEELSL
jgi:hypothetical protein